MDNERIQFPKGKQKEFIKYAKESSNLTWNDFSKKLEIKYNTIQNIFKENYRISEDKFNEICQFVNIDSKYAIKKFKGKKVNWNNLMALAQIKNKRIVGKSINKTSKTKILFNNKNINLNCSKIILSKKDIENKLILPSKITPLLAYETGTSLGDGCLPTRGKSYRLKGNINDEQEYYKNTIKPMFKELYNIDVNLKNYSSVIGFELYSKTLINFKNEIIGLPIGSKKDIKIPEIFKINNKKLLCSLISGLFDTDGSLYFRSQGKNKNYYPVLTIATISKKLAKNVSEILKMLGFNNNIYQTTKITKRTPNKLYMVRMYGYENFQLFKKIIGTKQPKNLNKIKKLEENWSNLNG